MSPFTHGPRRAFQTFGGFTSGIGIHYQPSAIVDTADQELARNLIIGQRILPQIFVRAADARPYEIQDLLPADMRFKLLVFTGLDLAPVNALAEKLEPVLTALTPQGKQVHDVFDILSIVQGTKEDVEYTRFPTLMRSHWSKYISRTPFFRRSADTYL
jgi:phenol 2-monooxygenase (NADPH)